MNRTGVMYGVVVLRRRLDTVLFSTFRSMSPFTTPRPQDIFATLPHRWDACAKTLTWLNSGEMLRPSTA